MHISIIIPVYNASKYVSEAVESALSQPETAEVILIEDGSTDSSLIVCQFLAEKYDKVYLYRHPNGENRGAGASRNVGIKQANCDYVAFLDADDFFLPGRFTNTRQIFQTNSIIDGVYEAVGSIFENEYAKKRWLSNVKMSGLTTMSIMIAPEDLYQKLISWNYGYFSLIGLTVKRSIFIKTGLFNEKLRLHQDTDMCWRMAAVGNLYPGKLNEPVTIRRIHEDNRISAPRSKIEKYQSNSLLLREHLQWGWKRIGKQSRRMLLKRYLIIQNALFWNLPFPKKIINLKNDFLNT